MSTKPLETLLYRELSRVAAKDIIEIASPLLQELVNYATNAFARCATSTSGRVDEDGAILTLYLHIIEMTDGVEVLVSQSCPVPAIPLVRSSFEALLSIKYVLEADYVRRSLSWLVDYTHRRLAFYECIDPSTDRGKAFQKSLRAHEYEAMQNLPLPPQAEVQKRIANLQDFLAKPHIQPIEAEFQRCKKEHKRRPNWYELFGGPGRTLYRLAHHLKRGVDYEILYRHWSSIAHAHDLSRFITGPTEGDSAIIRRLRDPSEIKEVTRHAALYILEATRLILGKFRPEESISGWYTREVRDRFLLISASQ
jgi:hypothetical protein